MAEYRGIAFTTIQNAGFDQEQGLVFNITESGIPAAVIGRMQGWKNQGYDVEIDRDGPIATGVATHIKAAQDYQYVERWGIRTELIVKPIWELTSVQIEVEAGLLDGWGSACDYRDGIERAVNDGTPLPAAYSLYPVSSKVLTELRRGVTGYEHDYTIVKRVANFDFKTPPAPLIMGTGNLIYTSAQLIANEQPPSDILFQMPTSDPTPSPGSMWGWRLTSQDGEITNALTGSHTTEWTYAEWSLFPYTAAS